MLWTLHSFRCRPWVGLQASPLGLPVMFSSVVGPSCAHFRNPPRNSHHFDQVLACWAASARAATSYPAWLDRFRSAPKAATASGRRPRRPCTTSLRSACWAIQAPNLGDRRSTSRATSMWLGVLSRRISPLGIQGGPGLRLGTLREGRQRAERIGGVVPCHGLPGARRRSMRGRCRRPTRWDAPFRSWLIP